MTVLRADIMGRRRGVRQTAKVCRYGVVGLIVVVSVGFDGDFVLRYRVWAICGRS